MIHLTRLIRLGNNRRHRVTLSLERAHVEPLSRQVVNRVLDRLLSVLVRLLTSQTHLLDTGRSSITHRLEVILNSSDVRLTLSRVRVHRRAILLHRLIHLLQRTIERSSCIRRRKHLIEHRAQNLTKVLELILSVTDLERRLLRAVASLRHFLAKELGIIQSVTHSATDTLSLALHLVQSTDLPLKLRSNVRTLSCIRGRLRIKLSDHLILACLKLSNVPIHVRVSSGLTTTLSLRRSRQLNVLRVREAHVNQRLLDILRHVLERIRTLNSVRNKCLRVLTDLQRRIAERLSLSLCRLNNLAGLIHVVTKCLTIRRESLAILLDRRVQFSKRSLSTRANFLRIFSQSLQNSRRATDSSLQILSLLRRPRK